MENTMNNNGKRPLEESTPPQDAKPSEAKQPAIEVTAASPAPASNAAPESSKEPCGDGQTKDNDSGKQPPEGSTGAPSQQEEAKKSGTTADASANTTKPNVAAKNGGDKAQLSSTQATVATASLPEEEIRKIIDPELKPYSEEELQIIDMQDQEFRSPEEVTAYLEKNVVAKTRPYWSIKVGSFPRLCTRALLEHCSKFRAPIVEFLHVYRRGMDRMNSADVKELVIAHGDTLRVLRFRPRPKNTAPPLVIANGYHNIKKYCTNLQVLEVTLANDHECRLLNLEVRRDTQWQPPILQVAHLEELILYNVRANTTKYHLTNVIQAAKRLKTLVLHQPELEDHPAGSGDLKECLQKIAQEAGNPNLDVTVKIPTGYLIGTSLYKS